ncbi:MAG: hypothetical protein M0P71_16945 [Melioribacteraceae bacterium]|nr:hypothetical protein [Melioribacteraceae bacterium]
MARKKVNISTAEVLPKNEVKSKYGKDIHFAVASEINEVKGSASVPSTSSSMRGNVAAVIPPTVQYANIFLNSVTPYPYGTSASYNGGAGGAGYGYNNGALGIWPSAAIQVVQAAYTSVPKITTTINLLTELCVGDLIFKGGTTQSRSFFSNWLEKLNSFDLQSQFFLEYWRSGSIYYYKLDTTLNKNTVKEFNQAFAANVESGKKLTIKYLLLNPSSIFVYGGSAFWNPTYYKVLNAYELSALFNNPSVSDTKLIEQVPELKKVVDQYKKGKKNNYGNPTGTMVVNLPLSPEKVVAVSIHRQDYEGCAVPMFYNLMPLLEQKMEYFKIDMAINRQILQAKLLVTAGDAELGSPSPKQIAALQEVFNSNSVLQVVVGDYTMKGEWLVPNVGELFSPTKYQALEDEIREGLNNVLLGKETYSSASIKTDVFIQRLEYARNLFLNQFLIPQMEDIAGNFGFKDIPKVEFVPLQIKERATRERVLTQMAQLGLLTDEELITALETNVLPTKSESVKNQTEYKELRDKGLYQPLVGGPKEGDMAGGRPAGAKAPQTTKKISTPGTVGAAVTSSAATLKEAFSSAIMLEKNVETQVKKKYNLKKLNNQQRELVANLSEQIIINEKQSDWPNKVDEYMDLNRKPTRTPVLEDITQLAADFGIPPYSAALFYHSLREVKD